MMWLLKSRMFWAATGVFLVAGAVALWLIVPPLLASISESRAATKKLDAQIQEISKLVAAGKTLKDNSVELDRLYGQATDALPTKLGTDYLMLQLDGLTKSLALDSSLTVPFKATAVPSSTATSDTTTSTDTVKPGASASNTAPVVQPSAEAKTTFTLSGKYGYKATLSLLDALRTFSRWNKITSIDITQNGDSVTSSITAEVFYSSTKPTDFAGEATDLLAKARSLFESLHSYTTLPSAKTEGTYGRDDPFALVR